jgi:hypothetical protein
VDSDLSPEQLDRLDALCDDKMSILGVKLCVLVRMARECIGLRKANALLYRGMEVSEEERMRLKLELRSKESPCQT